MTTKTNRREVWRRTPSIQTRRPDFQLVGHGMSDVGMRREANEDSFLMLPRNALWVVADGMGGHAGGQVASRITIETVASGMLRRLAAAEKATQDQGHRINIPAIVDATITEACAKVFDVARSEPELTGMGSTVTMMICYESVAYFGHVGDSRAYLIRDGDIHQITEDHSLVQEQVSAGLITPEQAKFSVMRNIITRSIGFEREVDVDTGAIPLQPGDAFVLCSDGLTGHVGDEEILDTVESRDRRRVPRALVNQANERGGEDNCTVICCYVLGRRRRRGRARRQARLGAADATLS